MRERDRREEVRASEETTTSDHGLTFARVRYDQIRRGLVLAPTSSLSVMRHAMVGGPGSARIQRIVMHGSRFFRRLNSGWTRRTPVAAGVKPSGLGRKKDLFERNSRQERTAVYPRVPNMRMVHKRSKNFAQSPFMLYFRSSTSIWTRKSVAVLFYPTDEDGKHLIKSKRPILILRCPRPCTRRDLVRRGSRW